MSDKWTRIIALSVCGLALAVWLTFRCGDLGTGGRSSWVAPDPSVRGSVSASANTEAICREALKQRATAAVASYTDGDDLDMGPVPAECTTVPPLELANWELVAISDAEQAAGW